MTPTLLEAAKEALAVIRKIKPPEYGNGTIVRLEGAIAEVETGAAVGAPEGWKLVPVEPTESMAKAYMNPSMTSWRQRYGAMLVAAPTLPAAQEKEA